MDLYLSLAAQLQLVHTSVCHLLLPFYYLHSPRLGQLLLLVLQLVFALLQSLSESPVQLDQMSVRFASLLLCALKCGSQCVSFSFGLTALGSHTPELFFKHSRIVRLMRRQPPLLVPRPLGLCCAMSVGFSCVPCLCSLGAHG